MSNTDSFIAGHGDERDTLPLWGSYVINQTLAAAWAAVDLAGNVPGAQALKVWGGAFTTGVFGTVDLAGAALHGSAEDVVLEGTGIGGSVLGGLAGVTIGPTRSKTTAFSHLSAK